MAQVTGAISSKDFLIEVGTDGTNWTDVSGAASTIEASGGAKMYEDSYTMEGDNPIVTVGKNESQELTLTAIYTEGASDLFELARPAYEAGSPFYIRWSPKGGQAGHKMYTAGPGLLTDLTYPSGDASSAAPVMTGIVFHGPRATPTTVGA